MPVVDPIAAIDGSLLDHVPPDVALESVLVPPAHVLSVPVIAAGDATTETVRVETHPVDRV